MSIGPRRYSLPVDNHHIDDFRNFQHMKKQKRNAWLIAIIGVIAGFLMGLWAGSQFLPRLHPTQLSDLSGEQQDQYVGLVALGYDSTGDFDNAVEQLNRLNAPNLELLVSGVLERAARQGQTPQQLSALARLALKLGAPQAALARYLPTPTPLPSPTATPTMVPPTPTPPPASSAAPVATATPQEVAEVVQPTATTEPTATPEPKPMVVAAKTINVRGGPGTAYPVVGSLSDGDNVRIVAKNAAGDWWQIRLPNEVLGWVYDAIVSITGDTGGIPVAANIAPPPATATPAAPPTPTQPPKPDVDFVVASVRLWGPQENGGYFDGPSLHCGEKRQLRVKVVDANGQPLDGVTVLGIYSHVEQVTGSKGPGMAEWILGDGDGLRVVRAADGSPVVSQTADGLVTDPHRISDEAFIAAGFCSDAASCQALRDGNACHGHYSWDVTFQRTY